MTNIKTSAERDLEQLIQMAEYAFEEGNELTCTQLVDGNFVFYGPVGNSAPAKRKEMTQGSVSRALDVALERGIVLTSEKRLQPDDDVTTLVHWINGHVRKQQGSDVDEVGRVFEIEGADW